MSKAGLLACSGLKKSYRQAEATVDVLKGVDIDIPAGSLCAIVGPSGAGKSTLLHLLGGLDRPSAGDVFFEGSSFFGRAEKEQAWLRNQAFGFVFQFYHLLPELTALENVALPGWMADGAPPREIDIKARRLLEELGLEKRFHHKPGELSGGEQQRVAIARALINQPKIVLCDEPTGNLDSATGHAILELLVDRNQKKGTTFLIVTHEPAVTTVAHRVYSLKDGKLWD